MEIRLGFRYDFLIKYLSNKGNGTLLNFFLLKKRFVFLSATYKSSQDRGHHANEKKVSILNILSIPTIWFSFSTFVVATICNGFLSINLEPKVLNFLIDFTTRFRRLFEFEGSHSVYHKTFLKFSFVLRYDFFTKSNLIFINRFYVLST